VSIFAERFASPITVADENFATHVYQAWLRHQQINTVDGGIDVLEFNPDQWEFLPGKYDVAVIPLTSLDGKTHAVHSITTSMFVNKARVRTMLGMMYLWSGCLSIMQG